MATPSFTEITEKPQPLPENPFQQGHARYRAFELCKNMELKHPNYPNVDDIVSARFLGFLISELSEQAGERLAKEINETKNNKEDLKNLSKWYMENLIRLFKATKGRTPNPEGHPQNRSSFEEDQAFMAEISEAAPVDNQTSKMAALHRDRFRCVVTGDADRRCLNKLQEEQMAKYNLMQGQDVTLTQYCHIFPASINWNLDNEKKKHWSGVVKAILERFGVIDPLVELNGRDVHSITNGFTMCTELHGAFDDLKLWFERSSDVDKPDTYQLRIAYTNRFIRLLATEDIHVTFTTTDPEKFPLPDRRYLDFHAVVCRVGHNSGALNRDLVIGSLE